MNYDNRNSYKINKHFLNINKINSNNNIGFNKNYIENKLKEIISTIK